MFVINLQQTLSHSSVSFTKSPLLDERWQLIRTCERFFSSCFVDAGNAVTLALFSHLQIFQIWGEIECCAH